jgi:hypothetical protein
LEWEGRDTGRDTLLYRANPGKFARRPARSGHASGGRDQSKKVRSGHIPSQPNGPDREHFHHKGTKAQRNPTCWVMFALCVTSGRDELKLGRDTNTGTGLISGRAGSACRRHGERDGTHCFTRKTSGIVRSETGRDRIETGATASAACPTKFRRRLHLSNLAGRDTLFHRADPGEVAPSLSPPSSIERGGDSEPAGTAIGSPAAREPVCWWWGSVFT